MHSRRAGFLNVVLGTVGVFGIHELAHDAARPFESLGVGPTSQDELVDVARVGRVDPIGTGHISSGIDSSFQERSQLVVLDVQRHLAPVFMG